MNTRLTLAVIGCAVTFGFGCSSPAPTSDAGSTETTGDDATDDDATDDDGGPATGVVPSGVRAILASKVKVDGGAPLFRGPHAVVGADPGDVVLDNALVRYVIRGAPNGVAMTGNAGGAVVDGGRIQVPDSWQTSPAGYDHLRELVTAMDSHQVRGDKVEILKDGSDGEAVVKVSGELMPLPALKDALNHEKPEITAFVTYTLREKSAALQIKTTIQSTKANKVGVMVAEIAMWDGESALFLPRYGDTNLPPAGQFQALGWTQRRAKPVGIADTVGAALVATKSMSMIDSGAFRAFLHNGVEATKAGVDVVRYLAIGGDRIVSAAKTGEEPRGDMAAALASAMKAVGGDVAKLRRVRGEALGSKSEYYEVSKHVDVMGDGKGPMTRCPVVGSGFDCLVPVGAKVLRIGWIGNGAAAPAVSGQYETSAFGHSTLPDNADDVDGLQADNPIAYAYLVTPRDTVDAQPLRTRVSLTHNAKTSDLPEGTQARHFFTGADKDGTRFLVPYGKWNVAITKGMFWTASTSSPTNLPIPQMKLSPTLSQAVDTKGWVSADLHVHTEASPDSRVPVDLRVEEALVEGLQYIVATDHDHVTDYKKWVQPGGRVKPSKCGALTVGDGGGWVHVAQGVEVTTMKAGHYNTWPAKPIAWHGRGPEQLFDAMDAGKDDRLVQCNHPESDSFSYFKAIDLVIGKTPAKLLRCDLLEVINGFEPEKTEQVIAIWLTLLQEGVVWTATGASDSHKSKDLLGSPRTMVYLPGIDTQDPCKATPAVIDKALRQGRAIATAGPLIALRAWVEQAEEKSAHVGETLDGAGKDVTAEATLTMSDALPPGTLELWVNAKKIAEKAVNSGKKANDAWSLTVQVKVPKSTQKQYVVAIHRPGKEPLNSPATSMLPWAVTNPVWIKR